MKENKKTELNEVEQTNETVIAVESETTESTSSPTPPNVVKLRQRRWLPYVITAAVLAALTLLFAWAKGAYTSTETWLMLWLWGDAFAIPGIVCFAVGILVWASNGGAFDIFAYGGRIFVRMFFKRDVKDRKYPTYYDYREARKEKKRSFWYMIIVGGAYLVVGVVLFVIGNQLMSK